MEKPPALRKGIETVDTVCMINPKRILPIFGALLLTIAQPSEALDLGNFKDFLRGAEKPAATPAKKAFQLPFLQPKATQKAAPYRALGDEADASYKNYTLTTLNGDQTPREEPRFSLPPETRIPEGLRPQLTDRKYPRQGISLSGNSGALLVPSPGVLEPGKTAVSVHAIPFDLYSVNDVRYQDENYFDTSVKLVYGASDGFEFGVDKTFSNQDRFENNEPTYVNMKYQVPGNITLGTNFCTDSQGGYHSAWVGAGVPVAWLGVGINWGASNFRFTYRGVDKLKRAKFGGYNYRYDKADGYADPVFFLVGGCIPMTSSTHFVYDFNGDRFSLGFRLNYQKVVFFDISYLADGDYERLPGSIAHKRLRNLVFGGTVAF